MTITAAPPHMQIGVPTPTWKVGPLTPRTCAGLLAELVLRAPNARSRPLVLAYIDTERDCATLYLVDRFAQAWLALLLTDYRPDLLPALPATIYAGADGVLPTTQLVRWWAEKPRRGAA